MGSDGPALVQLRLSSEAWNPGLAALFWNVHHVPGIILSALHGLTFILYSKSER